MFVINDAMIDSPPSTQSEILNSGIRGEIRSLLVEGGAGEDEENPLNRAISDFVSVCGLINVKNDDSSGKGETIVVDLLANLFSGISSLPSPQSGVVKICASDADGPSSDDSRLRFGEPTTLLGAISVRLANVFPNTSISVLHLLDLAIDVASQCLHTKDDKASASKFGKAPPPHAQAPSPFDRTLVKKLEHMASVLKVSLNIRRKFDALKLSHASVMSDADWDACWLLHCTLLLENSLLSPDSSPTLPETQLLKQYKQCISCVAFFIQMREGTKSPATSPTPSPLSSPMRRRLQSMEDEAGAALLMMPEPSKYTNPDQMMLKLAVQTKLSVKNIEEGVHEILKRCKTLISESVFGQPWSVNFPGKDFRDKVPSPSEMAKLIPEDSVSSVSTELRNRYDSLISSIPSRPNPPADFIVDSRPLISPASCDLMGRSYLISTSLPKKQALVRFSSITGDNNEDINALADHNKSLDASSSSSLFFNAPNVTFLFDLTASSLPAVSEIVSSSATNSNSSVPFIPGHPSLPTPSSPGTNTQNLPVSAAQTPITSALEQMDWVILLSTSQPKPSSNLMSYFAGGGDSATFLDMRVLLDSLLNKISTNSSSDPSVLSLPLSQDDLPPLSATSSSSTSSTPVSSPAHSLYLTNRGVLKHPPNGQFPDKLRRSSLDVYYKTLQSILNWETSRLQTHNHSALLTNKGFHRSLFACCAEVVLFSNSCLDLKFPHVLNFCSIDAFTFLKSIETFVRHANLPPALKKHLSEVEESILSQHAWSDDCSLYNLLLQHQAHPSWPPALLRTEGDEFNIAHRVVPKPPSSSPPPSFQAVSLFFKKLMGVVLGKVKRICSKLNIEDSLSDLIWTVFKYCVAQKLQLFHGRHVDPIIMCCVYCTYKSVKPSPNHMRFTSIIKAYKEIYPERSEETNKLVRNIALDERKIGKAAKGDVIAFNNRIFAPALKEYVENFRNIDVQVAAMNAVELDSGGKFYGGSISAPSSVVGTPAGSPVKKRSRDDSDAFIDEVIGRRHKVPAISRMPLSSGYGATPTRVENSNVFLVTGGMGSNFPGRGNKARGRILFEFGGTGGKELELINDMMKRDWEEMELEGGGASSVGNLSIPNLD